MDGLIDSAVGRVVECDITERVGEPVIKRRVDANVNLLNSPSLSDQAASIIDDAEVDLLRTDGQMLGDVERVLAVDCDIRSNDTTVHTPSRRAFWYDIARRVGTRETILDYSSVFERDDNGRRGDVLNLERTRGAATATAALNLELTLPKA